MASVKLDLIDGIWQEVGAISFVWTQKDDIKLECVNADSLPVGDVPAAMVFRLNETQVIPKPTNGSWYVRVPSGGEGYVKYTEVTY